MSTGHPSPDALKHYLEVAAHLDELACRPCEEALRQLQGAAEVQATLQVQAALAGVARG
jgi:hypothetical protein